MKEFNLVCKPELLPDKLIDEGDIKGNALEVYCDNLSIIELTKLISMLAGKGFKITFINVNSFNLKAEIEGNKKELQDIRKDLEKEGFTQEILRK